MRLAAFAFSELAEASSTLAALGEARSKTARRAYKECVDAAVGLARGRLLASAGDTALVEFDSASDALVFASALQRHCEREAHRWGERLDLRIALDVGEATTEDLPDAHALGAAGRVQQLVHATQAGKVIATSIVPAIATSAEATFQPAGLVSLAGWPQPVGVVEVVFHRVAADQPPLPVELENRGQQTGFVGRGGEREKLRAIWQSALGGARQLAFVTGEPGIGKTRLVAEFARTLHQEGAEVLWGRSFEEALSPYQPFVQALQHHIRWTGPDELRAEVGSDAAVLTRLVPELQARVPAPPVVVDNPDSERYRLFEAAGRMLATASADRPILLVLDDLQWADQGTLLLLRHVVTQTTPALLLVLGTYRHTEVGREHPLALMQADVERDRLVERIELSGLAVGEVGALVGSLIGWHPPDVVVQTLRGETQGNPLFVEEVVRHLQELGLSADPERMARLQATAHELGVPARVRELVARRVQRLSHDAQQVLAAAAVIGSEFSSDVLAQMLGETDLLRLVSTLDEAVEARILVEAADGVGSYGFSHALIQQALYDEQTRNRRATMHERAAQALERCPAGRELRDAELAYHYARAGSQHAGKVVVHGRAAAERALRLIAYEDAVRNVSAALGALQSLPERDEHEHAELLTLLGTANYRAGEYEAARAAFHEAAEIAAACGAWQVLARAVLGYGGGTGFGGVWTTFAAVDEELVRLLEVALEACPPGDSHERVRLLGRLAQALYWSTEEAGARALSEEALTIARRLGDRTALAYALDSRHVVLWSPDYLAEERALAEEMLEIGRSLGDPDVQLEALAWLITDTLETDPLEVADAYIKEHARIAAELRQPYHLWYTEATHAMRAHLDGRFEEAAALAEKAYAYGRHSHGENATQTYLVQTMFLKLDLGQLDDLIEGLEKYVAGSPLSAWRAALALALAGLDRRRDALEQVAWFAEQGFGSIRRDCVWETSLTAIGRTVGHFEDATYADELYRLLLPFAGRNCVVGGAVLCLGPMSRILGMLARAGGHADLALEHFDTALAGSRALRSVPLVARTQLEAAKAHLMRGTEEDRHTAERLLAEAGAAAQSLGMAKLAQDIEVVKGGGIVGAAAR